MPQLTMSQLQQALQSSLEHSGLERSAAEQALLVEVAARQLAAGSGPTENHERRVDSALFDADVAYAIPDDALNLFPSLVQAAVGAFAKGPIGALSDVVGLLLRYRSLRVEVSAEEAAVLRVLRDAKTDASAPLALADIADRLAAKGLTLKRPLPDVLAELLRKKTDKATLVRETSGRWAIGNV